MFANGEVPSINSRIAIQWVISRWYETYVYILVSTIMTWLYSIDSSILFAPINTFQSQCWWLGWTKHVTRIHTHARKNWWLFARSPNVGIRWNTILFKWQCHWILFQVQFFLLCWNFFSSVFYKKSRYCSANGQLKFRINSWFENIRKWIFFVTRWLSKYHHQLFYATTGDLQGCASKNSRSRICLAHPIYGMESFICTAKNEFHRIRYKF